MPETTGHGPEILDGLRASRAAFEDGNPVRSHEIVDELRDQYGDVQVDAVLGALRLGFIAFEEDPDA